MKFGLFKPAFHLLSPAGEKAKLLVFIFHRVLAKADPLLVAEPDTAQFDWMMQFVSKNFNILPFGEAVSLLYSGKLPSASACISFDDGYQDNYSVALPILQRYGIVGTFFIATAFLNGGRMWNDDIIEAIRASPSNIVNWSDFGLGEHNLSSHQGKLTAIDSVLKTLKYFPHTTRETIAREISRRAGVPDKSSLMMSDDEVRSVHAAGMEIGGHTHSHPILSELKDGEAFSEITRGKIELEKILSDQIHVFAYPNGNPKRDLDSRHPVMLREAGFHSAATTEKGFGKKSNNRFMIPRFTPWDRTPTKFAIRCAFALSGRI